MSNYLWAVIVAAGIPSAVVGFLVTRLNKKLDKRETEKDEKEKARLEHETKMINVLMATLDLSIATAEAVQRIPDSNCNGDMHSALEHAKRTQQKYREFERELSVKAIN